MAVTLVQRCRARTGCGVRVGSGASPTCATTSLRSGALSLALLQPSTLPSPSSSEEVASILPSSPICRTRSSPPCRASSAATPSSTRARFPCSATSRTSWSAAETKPYGQAGSLAAAAYQAGRAPGAVPPNFTSSFADGVCGPLARRLGPLRRRLRREHASVPRVPNSRRPAAGTQCVGDPVRVSGDETP